jgi:hypothetical protein
MRLVGAPPMAATSAMVDRQQIVDLAPLQRVELEGWPLIILRRLLDRRCRGLEDRSGRARSCPHRTPAELEAWVFALRIKTRRWS